MQTSVDFEKGIFKIIVYISFFKLANKLKLNSRQKRFIW